MGKPPYKYTDSETDDSCSSTEDKKKKKFSILKYTNGNVKKKKCKIHSKSEPEDSDHPIRSRSSQRVRYKLPGILKNSTYERDYYIDSASVSPASEDEESEPVKPRRQDRCLVGRVPRPAGAKPGRGGGVAIIVKKNVSDHCRFTKIVRARRLAPKGKSPHTGRCYRRSDLIDSIQ
ncbi:uncharacterized protein LOC110379482 isoform X1 [Helicoverpa armigera]|uniref:uncharacterized protein LOC110379482 isoform X1 n=1 Tax=Helicoverpa armigera TaxID=29058 RepID=UPI000B37C6DF|nr:uncharacterized protein LOC110379482 isoform X1 [Helicoverpa armigera]